MHINSLNTDNIPVILLWTASTNRLRHLSSSLECLSLGSYLHFVVCCVGVDYYVKDRSEYTVNLKFSIFQLVGSKFLRYADVATISIK